MHLQRHSIILKISPVVLEAIHQSENELTCLSNEFKENKNFIRKKCILNANENCIN